MKYHWNTTPFHELKCQSFYLHNESAILQIVWWHFKNILEKCAWDKVVVSRWRATTLTAPVGIKVAVEVGAEAAAVWRSWWSVLPPQSSLYGSLCSVSQISCFRSLFQLFGNKWNQHLTLFILDILITDNHCFYNPLPLILKMRWFCTLGLSIRKWLIKMALFNGTVTALNKIQSIIIVIIMSWLSVVYEL